MDVIFHIDEIEKWELTISNIKNMLVYGKENHDTYHIEIVANSDAVECLSHRNDEYQAVMEKLSEDGVIICRSCSRWCRRACETPTGRLFLHKAIKIYPAELICWIFFI